MLQMFAFCRDESRGGPSDRPPRGPPDPPPTAKIDVALLFIYVDLYYS